jgi:hypothetical protein
MQRPNYLQGLTQIYCKRRVAAANDYLLLVVLLVLIIVCFEIYATFSNWHADVVEFQLYPAKNNHILHTKICFVGRLPRLLPFSSGIVWHFSKPIHPCLISRLVHDCCNLWPSQEIWIHLATMWTLMRCPNILGSACLAAVVQQQWCKQHCKPHMWIFWRAANALPLRMNQFCANLCPHIATTNWIQRRTLGHKICWEHSLTANAQGPGHNISVARLYADSPTNRLWILQQGPMAPTHGSCTPTLCTLDHARIAVSV